ncbi:MAG: 2-C-methyl-D-erythritol 2,4-cyclodiphosphate synthase [Bacteroidales bacterium]
MDVRIGFGYDSHQLIGGRDLVIGGVKIPHSKGMLAHSDGDVLIHALCDALLGAAALKDIGTHFPDTDNQYQNIDSKILLFETMSLIQREGWHVNNADTTVVIETPKIAPYIDKVVANLSSLLQISSTALSIKAKTNEKLGFVGREEGVAAYAVVTLVR